MVSVHSVRILYTQDQDREWGWTLLVHSQCLVGNKQVDLATQVANVHNVKPIAQFGIS